MNDIVNFEGELQTLEEVEEVQWRIDKNFWRFAQSDDLHKLTAEKLITWTDK